MRKKKGKTTGMHSPANKEMDNAINADTRVAVKKMAMNKHQSSIVFIVIPHRYSSVKCSIKGSFKIFNVHEKITKLNFQNRFLDK